MEIRITSFAPFTHLGYRTTASASRQATTLRCSLAQRVIHLICTLNRSDLLSMQILDTWKQHPLTLSGAVELVPVSWVWKYRGVDVSDGVDMPDEGRSTLEEFWDVLKKDGLRDPLIVRVGLKDRKMRLEAGNHRIQVLHAHGVTEVPVTIQVHEECGPHAPDVMNSGSHNFDIPHTLRIREVTREYMKPTEVFTELV